MPEPMLDHQAIKIRELNEDCMSGRVVVPEFQREQVQMGTLQFLIWSRMNRNLVLIASCV
jgi:hypothetical protein